MRNFYIVQMYRLQFGIVQEVLRNRAL